MRQLVLLLGTIVGFKVYTFTHAQITRAPNTIVKILLLICFDRLERSLRLTDGDIQALLKSFLILPFEPLRSYWIIENYGGGRINTR